jgi:predicted metal-dependent phosphoesterase TrpH
VDLHVHTSASYDYEDNDEPIIAVLEAACEAGLDAIAITDHNTFQGYVDLVRDVSKLRRREPSRYAELSRIAILPGIEVSCLGGKGGLHLIGIFDPDRCKLGFVARSLRLKEAVADEISGGTRLARTPEEIAGIIHRYGGLAIAAHVGTRNGILHECRPQVARLLVGKCRLDALEYSKETHNEETVSLRLAQQIADTAGIPLIASSDAHVLVSKRTGTHRRGIGERYTELECDHADFVSIRETLALPEKTHRESMEALREPWRNEARFREAVRAGRSLRLDFIYSDRDIPRLIKLANSLLNAQGGSLLIGVGGGAERVRIGSKRLHLSGAELKATIQSNIDPTPDIDVLSADLGDGRTIVQVLIDKRRNPLFYFTTAGRAFTREQRRVVSLELNCDCVAGPFLREVGRSTLMDRSRLKDRVEKLSTDRQAALLAPDELLCMFPSGNISMRFRACVMCSLKASWRPGHN